MCHDDHRLAHADDQGEFRADPIGDWLRSLGVNVALDAFVEDVNIDVVPGGVAAETITVKTPAGVNTIPVDYKAKGGRPHDARISGRGHDDRVDEHAGSARSA